VTPVIDTSRWSPRKLLLFVVCEVAFLFPFLYMAYRGDLSVGTALLFVPMQILLFVYVSASFDRLLLYFVSVFPLSALELLPYKYTQLAVYAGATVLAALFVLDDHVAGGDQSGRPRAPRVFVLGLGMLVLCAVVSAVAALVRGWWSQFIPHYSVLLFVAISWSWFAATRVQTERQVRGLLLAMAISYGVVGLALPVLASGAVGGDIGKTLMTPFGVVNLNVLASHVASFGVVAIGLSLEPGTARRASFAVVGALLAGVLIYSKSRGAWVGFAVGYLYLMFRRKSVWLVAPAVAVAGAVMASDLLRSLLTWRIAQTSSSDPALWARFLLWQFAVDIFRGNWLVGVGWENFRYVKQLFGYPLPMTYGTVFNTNNLLLEFAVDLGVPGLVAFLLLCVRSIAVLDRAARRAGGMAYVAAAVNAGLVTFLVHGLFDCVTWQHGALMLLFLLLGLAVAIERSASAQVPSSVSMGR
jgi:O-antigen ligase